MKNIGRTLMSKGVFFFSVLFLAGCGQGITISGIPPISQSPGVEYRIRADEFRPEKAVFHAGFSKYLISPSDYQWLAGFRPSRIGFFSHGDLSARCLVISDKNKSSLGIVSLDLIGFLPSDVAEMQKEIGVFFAGKVLIHTTHTHSAPDVVGLWGQDLSSTPFLTGRDEQYVRYVKNQTVSCMKDATSSQEPAVLSFASSTLTKIARGPKDMTRDESFLLGHIRTKDRSFVLINYAVHPIAIHSNYVTADFPHYIYKYIEETGREVMFINGAIGAVSPVVHEKNLWLGAERIGVTIAKEALSLLPRSEVSVADTINWQSRTPRIFVENQRFIRAGNAGLIRDERDGEGRMGAEVNYVVLGDAGIITFPGEAFPNIALNLKDEMDNRYTSVFGLTNSGLGYILFSGDYHSEKYGHQVGLSLGSAIGDILYKELSQMVKPH